jgi:ABC-type branched-subunit amino acid transport system ATPase component
MTRLLDIQELSHQFGAVQALVSVDLHVDESEILAIIGPNGCGKTTLFNCVSGRLRPTGGRVLWLGEDITRSPMYKVARRGLIRTFQETRVFPSGTPRSNLEMVLAISKPRNAGVTGTLPDSPGDLLQFCGLEDVADTPVRGIPFGHSRRLGIAIALAAGPKLLLLDEPAAGLNDAETADFADFLRRLHQHGLTLAIVDHDMDFLLPLADRVVVLASGRKLREGSAAEVRSDPAVIEVYLGTMGSTMQRLTAADTADVGNNDG